jgi:hypothetical protein
LSAKISTSARRAKYFYKQARDVTIYKIIII